MLLAVFVFNDESHRPAFLSHCLPFPRSIVFFINARRFAARLQVCNGLSARGVRVAALSLRSPRSVGNHQRHKAKRACERMLDCHSNLPRRWAMSRPAIGAYVICLAGTRGLACTRCRRYRVRCLMEPEVGHGETEVYSGVQA